MLTPLRYSSLPKRTMSGTTLTPSACASDGVMSDALSVTRWITSLEVEHIWIVLLAPGVQFELSALVRTTKGCDQSLRIRRPGRATAVHRGQPRRPRMRGQDSFDDVVKIVPDLGDLVIDHRDDVTDF